MDRYEKKVICKQDLKKELKATPYSYKTPNSKNAYS